MAGDMVPTDAHNVGAKEGRRSKARGAEVLDSTNKGLGGARHGVPAAAVSDDLATLRFFWILNVRELWVALFRSARVAVSKARRVEPMRRVTSASVSGEFSGALQCSPGRRR